MGVPHSQGHGCKACHQLLAGSQVAHALLKRPVTRGALTKGPNVQLHRAADRRTGFQIQNAWTCQPVYSTTASVTADSLRLLISGGTLQVRLPSVQMSSQPFQPQAPELAELYQFKTGLGKQIKPASAQSWQRANQLLSGEQSSADLQGHPLSSWPIITVVCSLLP